MTLTRWLLSALAVAFVAPSHAAISLAQAIVTDDWTGVNQGNCVLGSNAAADNSIIAGIIIDSATGISVSSVTITSESNATSTGAIYNPTVASRVQGIEFFYLSDVSTAGAKTITFNLSGAVSFDVFCAELTGTDTTGALDVDGGGASGSGTTASDGLTTGSANSAVFCLANGSGGELSAGTGYTAFTLSNIFWWYEGAYDIDVGAAGAQTPSMTQASGDWGIRCAAFKAAGGGGGGLVVNPISGRGGAAAQPVVH